MTRRPSDSGRRAQLWRLSVAASWLICAVDPRSLTKKFVVMRRKTTLSLFISLSATQPPRRAHNGLSKLSLQVHEVPPLFQRVFLDGKRISFSGKICRPWSPIGAIRDRQLRLMSQPRYGVRACSASAPHVFDPHVWKIVPTNWLRKIQMTLIYFVLRDHRLHLSLG